MTQKSKESDAKPGYVYSFSLGHANEEGRFVATPIPESELEKPPAFVENRRFGKREAPSSLMVTLMRSVMDPALPDVTREGALEILVDWFFPRPVYGARWRLVLKALRERAQLHGSTERDELRTAVESALAAIGNVESSPDRPFERELRKRVDRAVCEDLLGPEWHRRIPKNRRRGPLEVPLAEAAREEGSERQAGANDRRDPADAVLARQFASELIEKARLTPAESEVLAAVVEGWEPAEWAEETGRQPSTVRSLLSRARKKLRKATQGPP